MAGNPGQPPIQDGAGFHPIWFQPRNQDAVREELREFREEQIRAERRRADRLRHQHEMHRRPREHRLRASELRHRVYNVEKIFADRLENFECALCKTYIVNTEFEDHLEACAREKGVSENQTNLTKYHFLSQPYFLEQEIFKIREMLEIEYLEVTADREKIMDMHCVICQNPHDHKGGMCYPDRQKSAFKLKVNHPVQLYMAHYENWLFYTKQKGLDEIEEKHAAHFASIERFMTSEQVDLRQYINFNMVSPDIEKIIQYRKILRDDGLEAANNFETVAFPDLPPPEGPVAVAPAVPAEAPAEAARVDQQMEEYFQWFQEQQDQILGRNP
ncbi:Protein CBG24291 [Caenorhabditis briggsae]|uniref:Protein CBG24291 n=1 Tax=Caenorhabditis briggsae TaxID=6238 RepID=A8WKE1_CAEBR|nr:Protein CBG24291 [Caenorhabditis briggsae]CAP20936.2 Protein CBG24291 [Caenorhabditis briggsae]